MKDVSIRHRNEEFVEGIIPKLRLANMKEDVPITQGKEEFVPNMERRGRSILAGMSMQDVPTKLY